MKIEQLLSIYDIQKDGKIRIEHHPFDKVPNISITLENLFEMFKAVDKREDEAIKQDQDKTLKFKDATGF